MRIKNRNFLCLQGLIVLPCGPILCRFWPDESLQSSIHMKISYSWLQSLIHLPESPSQVAQWLTQSGLEVESIHLEEKVRGNLEGIVIGEVMACEKHPDADKLSLTQVNIGQAENLSIVCGAPNVAKGQKVAVAIVGATLYPTEGEPFTIKKSKIRGALSEGMLCAEDELGLGRSHAGIMVLDTPLPNGTPLAKLFDLEPIPVLEIGLTPNRADAASHLGVARDLRALLNRPVVFPETTTLAASSPSPIMVQVEDSAACPRYAGLYLEGIKVGPSPDWLQTALKSIGLQPINNVVDVTNYVLHELGQPMHAFDVQKLSGNTIHVRRARVGEELITLDKSLQKLHAEDLVIADEKGPVAFAGVMGGLHSGVSPETTAIFLESAYFHPAEVRKSAQRHGLKTDSSFRFERGTDPWMPFKALERAAHLLIQVAGARPAHAPVDFYPSPIEAQTFAVKTRNIHRLIGKELALDTIYQILNQLDIQTTPGENYGHPGFEETFTVSVPPYRVDVCREADIVEEIIRIYGIDNLSIEGPLKTDFISPRSGLGSEQKAVRAGQYLADLGFFEVVTNSLSNPAYSSKIEEIDAGKYVHLLNPLSEELSVMRQTLLFSGLEALAWNINRRQNNLKLFELGKVYQKTENGYSEGYRLGLFATGLVQENSWETGKKEVNFYHLKKWVSNLLQRLGHQALQWKSECGSAFSYGLSLYAKGKKLGELGLVSPSLSSGFGVQQAVFAAELDWDLVLKSIPAPGNTQEISKFPEVRRDLSIVLDKSVSFDRIEQIVRTQAKGLLKALWPFDVYEGEKIAPEKKAYAISLTLQDSEKTLTDNQIDRTMQNIMQKLEGELGAVIRR